MYINMYIYKYVYIIHIVFKNISKTKLFEDK